MIQINIKCDMLPAQPVTGSSFTARTRSEHYGMHQWAPESHGCLAVTSTLLCAGHHIMLRSALQNW